MKELEAYRLIMSDLPVGIIEAEAEAEKNDLISAGIINGKETGLSASDKTGIFVRASGARTGMTYTQNLEANPKDVLLEALHNSDYVQEEKSERLNDTYMGTPDISPEHVSFDLLLLKARELEKMVRKYMPDATYICVKVSENLRTVGIVNSLGLDRTFTKRIAEAELSLTCETGLHRSLSLETSAHTVEAIQVDYFMAKLKEWLSLPLYRASLPSKELPAVLNGSVMCNILLTAWQMFSGVQYLSKGTPFYGKLGERIFSERINISDIPQDSVSGYGRSFDCEGTTSQRVDIIKEGRFETFMHNLTTADKLGSISTGNAGRDVNLISDQTECKVIPTNFTLLPGPDSKEELLSKLEEGIYIYESFDMFHSVNTASGDFTIPCQGIYYLHGKPAGRIEGITMNGNLLQLLKDIEMIADDRTTVSMIMSKSFAISAVSVLVNKMQFRT